MMHAEYTSGASAGRRCKSFACSTADSSPPRTKKNCAGRMIRVSRTSVSTSAGLVNPGATTLANGRANTISSAIPMLPTSRMKFAMTLKASQLRLWSPRSRCSRKIGMKTIDKAPAASR